MSLPSIRAAMRIAIAVPALTPGIAAAAEVPGLLFSLDPVSERPGPSIRTSLLLALPHRRPSSPAPRPAPGR